MTFHRDLPKVEIYTRRFCGYCTMAKRLLERHGIPYVEHDATGDAAIRAEMIQRSGGAFTFPQIFVGQHHVGGCRELYAWESHGGLERLAVGLLKEPEGKA